MTENRRRYVRVAGPFDGRRLSLIDTPAQIYDLSEGGCFVNSTQDQPQGREVLLEIHLPSEGWITVKAKTLYSRAGFGFAVLFVGLEGDTRERLAREIQRLQDLEVHGR